jgi:amidase
MRFAANRASGIAARGKHMKGPYPRTSLLLALAFLGLPTVGHAKDGGDFHPVEATIADIQAAYRSGTLSPEDLVRMYLRRIATYDQSSQPQPLKPLDGPQPLNSFMHVNERAAADARKLELGDLDRDDGDDDGGKPLFGIPIILKDNIATKDMPTTAGSVALGGSRPEKDAFIARKLRRAGAIILGKGTLTEFANFIALGMPTGFSSQLRFQLFQTPGADLSKVGYGFNAYDPRIDPRKAVPDGRPVLQTGGSSSGPGIAVGANLATVGVGTETSGSILSPSGQNSLVGIKPTLGLVSRHGIVPITADQDTAGPMARTVTDAARLLGVLAGFDENDPATRGCLTPGNCPRDYTKFLEADALKGAHIAVPKNPYWTPDFGLGAARTALMNAAIAQMTSMGATFEDCDIPSQGVLSNFGTCVTVDDVKLRRANPDGAPPAPCSTVLLNGFKNDLNTYLADKDFGPGVSASNSLIPVRTIHTLSDVIAFNSAHPEVALKYKQQIAEGADFLTSQKDVDDYRADRAYDLLLTQKCGLDILYTGVVPKQCEGLVKIQASCKDKKFDAVLFPANFGANAPARAGYPSVIVPAGFFPNLNTAAILKDAPNFNPQPSPFGVTFSGPAFSEPRLIAFAYAFEQATHHRKPPKSTPPLSTDVVGR